jgi:hypothetical protein
MQPQKVEEKYRDLRSGHALHAALRAAAWIGAALTAGGLALPCVHSDEPAQSGWRSLFDGKSLSGWKSSPFGGEGQVEVVGGAIILQTGETLTGVTCQKPLPVTNYEVELEAQRVEGSDFFCGLTFPVQKSFCSFIVGGWGGGVVGLSSIDGMDASENETTKYREFKKGRWYKIRVRVTDHKIEAWIDDDKMVDQDITERKVGTRIEVDRSKPFGISSWRTKAALRNIRIRNLAP